MIEKLKELGYYTRYDVEDKDNESFPLITLYSLKSLIDYMISTYTGVNIIIHEKELNSKVLRLYIERN